MISRTVIWTDVVPSFVVLKPVHTAYSAVRRRILHERRRKATRRTLMPHDVRRRKSSYVDAGHCRRWNYMLLTIIYYVAGATQRNDGRQCNVRRRNVCDCCCRNRLQRRRFSLITNIVAVTRMCTGCESSRKCLEAQVISSSLDGWTVAWRPGRWGGWSSALITLSSAVLSLSLSLTTPTFFLSPCCLYIGMSLVQQPAIYASEQVL